MSGRRQLHGSATPASFGVGAGRLCGVGVAALAAAAGLSLTAAAPAPPYRDGPPPGFSGGFGEESCQACHFSADLNEAPGKLMVEGIPDVYQPGEPYPLVITLTRPGMALGGFQLSARFEAGGTQSGDLSPVPGDESRVRVSLDREIQYAYQQDAGAGPVSTDTLQWSVLWTAPAGQGNVVFSAAANAADGDDTAEGDYVYTSSWRSRAGQ